MKINNGVLLERTIEYLTSKMIKCIMTSRFNDKTWDENVNYRTENNWKGCIYGSPQLNSISITQDCILFIIEMNNDKNQVMGIGLVRNNPMICMSGLILDKKNYGPYLSAMDAFDKNQKKMKIYNNGSYNRYIFMGKHRIDRTEMTDAELKIIKALDVVCFTGNYHMKRGNGLKSFPRQMLEKAKEVIDLEQEFTNMFKQRFSTGGGGVGIGAVSSAT